MSDENEFTQKPLTYEEVQPARESIKNNEINITDKIGLEFAKLALIPKEVTDHIVKAISLSQRYYLQESKDSFENWLEHEVAAVKESLDGIFLAATEKTHGRQKDVL